MYEQTKSVKSSSIEQGLILELGAPQTDGTSGSDITDKSDRNAMWKWSWLQNFNSSKVNGSQEPQPAPTGMLPASSSTIKSSDRFHLMIKFWFLTPLTPTSLYFVEDCKRKDAVITDLLSLFDQLLVFTCVLYAVMLIEAERQKCRLRNQIKHDNNLPLFVGQLPAYIQDQEWLYCNSFIGFIGTFYFANTIIEGNNFGEIWKDLIFYCATIIFLGFAQIRLLDLQLYFRVNQCAVLEFISENKICVYDLARQREKLAWHLWNFAIKIMWALTALVYIVLLYTNTSINPTLNFESWNIKNMLRIKGNVHMEAMTYTSMIMVMFVGFTEALVAFSSLYKREYDINRLRWAIRNKNRFV